ncbi:cation diffusion facilitator family transporter [Aspergillus lucknowensis]|uniref:Cation efflux protein transmembrane domain-containing protein n=1 Tax=Aspergillus lucknowensis TaxID=176173 RepID=A0ABR4LV33_9EURO
MASFRRSRTPPHLPVSPPSSDTESPIRPRRPSLNSQGELLSTRGQYLPSLIRRRSFSTQRSDGFLDAERDDVTSFRDRVERPALARARDLIGEGRLPFNWHQYYQHPNVLKGLTKSVRQLYERNNDLISQYVYIDRLLDSSLPHRLIVDYQHDGAITEYANGTTRNAYETGYYGSFDGPDRSQPPKKIKRTPRNLYRIPSESSLLMPPTQSENGLPLPGVTLKGHDFVHSGARIVTVAIYVNFAANVILLAAKIAALLMTNSVSVLASLVDGALDFLSTTIVWITTALIRRQDRHKYPISRRRLEPLSVLVFAVVMVTSFFQVAITSMTQLISSSHSVVHLSVASAVVMASTVVVKFLCWLWCRLINNSSVQALAQDAMTDVIFNWFSIVFPLIGGLTKTWFLDPLGGLLLSVYIIWNWGSTASEHIRHLTGAAASPMDVSILLYMTMRFSRSILKVQNLRAYYAGDLLNVEVDIVLEGKTSLRDSHDLGESLQYMLESLPTVERAFVHMDYDPWNIPSHMNQQES